MCIELEPLVKRWGPFVRDSTIIFRILDWVSEVFAIPGAGSVLRPCAEHQNTIIKSMRITYMDSNIMHQSTMPSNRTSNDIDLVPPT